MRQLLKVQNLRKSFGDHRVIDDISFTVEEGTVTVILGPSGSGKTTLLRSLNGLELPESGTVSINDVSVDFGQVHPGKRGQLPKQQRASIARLTDRSAMVFQSYNLFPNRTALENVTEGPVVVQGVPAAQAREQALELLDKVGLSDHVSKYPYQLSGGQQQRVGIARALALKPELVLFDEPTSALDPELVGDVLRVMRDLAAEGWSMVIVTHEVKFAAQVADQVLFIDNGLIVEQGPPAQVISNAQNPRTQDFLRRILEPI
ncbi:amino acid ABC transporter ATP-binding protein [Calidifontibacter terrae]